MQAPVPPPNGRRDVPLWVAVAIGVCLIVILLIALYA